MGKHTGSSTKIRNEANMPTISAMISIILEGLINAILQNKSITGIKIDKEEINLYLDGMILYQKNS